ncbi:MAG: histidine--tRNA ligase, partial [Legionellales bacterium]
CGVGFALGVERLLLLRDVVLARSADRIADIYVIIEPDFTGIQAMQLAEQCRGELLLRVICNCGAGSMKAQFKKADKSGADLALIVGQRELDQGKVGVKFLRVKLEQEDIELAKLTEFLIEHFKKIRQ